MSKQVDGEFAKSAAEAPLVIAYVAALVVFAHAWSHFNPPTTSVVELMSIAAAKNSGNDYAPLP